MDDDDKTYLSTDDVMTWQRSVVAEWDETAAEVATRATVNGLRGERVTRAIERSGLSREKWMLALKRLQRELVASLE